MRKAIKNINLIKPKISKESDKYSWNLYCFLKTNPYVKAYKSKNGEIYLLESIREDFIGNSLNSIITTDKKPSECFAFINEQHNFKEISDFFKRYKKIGRCLFLPHDISWIQGGDKRYTYINKHSRRCNWCGEYQTRKIKKIVKIERRENWVSTQKFIKKQVDNNE